MIFIHHHGDSEREEIASGDICDECGRDFGFSGDDGNGAYNSRCVHCGSTYYTSKEEEDECQPLKSGR